MRMEKLFTDSKPVFLNLTFLPLGKSNSQLIEETSAACDEVKIE